MLLVAHGSEEFVPKAPLTSGKQLLAWYLAVPIISLVVIIAALVLGIVVESKFNDTNRKAK